MAPNSTNKRSESHRAPGYGMSSSSSLSSSVPSSALPSPHQRPSKRSRHHLPEAADAAQAAEPLLMDIEKTETDSLIPGDVFVVGSGDCGQLGLGQDILEKERPALLAVLSDKEIVSIKAGGLHNAVLTRSGTVWTWGCNDQCALGRIGEETEPGPVVDGGILNEKIVSLACGDSVTAALTANGRVYTWGTFRDNNGIFGLAPGVKTQRIPRLVPELKHIVQIEAGANHLIAMSREGKIYTWGVGEQGQLGRKIMSRHATDAALTPRPINFRPPRHSAKFTGAFAGGYHSFLVHESGAVYAFGLNNYGQLGLGHTDPVSGPELIEGLEETGTHFISIQGGEHHSIGLDSKGHSWVWGRGDSGQLGLSNPPPTQPISRPTPLTTVSNVSHISAGGAFSLAISRDTGNSHGPNSLYGWGYGEMGQLANESEDAPVPHRFALKDRRVFEASAGGQHTLLLLSPKDSS